VQVSLPAEGCSDMTSELVAEGFTAFVMARPLREFGMMAMKCKGFVIN
jgi:hypothetical protein